MSDFSFASLYIHWPFCLSKCPYCDFNSHVRERIEEDKWIEALCSNLAYTKEITNYSHIQTIFFGGGTPSLMAPQSIERILSFVAKLWSLPKGTEISMEANPNAVEQNKLKDFKKAGINRLSLGIQSLYEDDLKFLGRSHSKEEALTAIRLGREIFDNFSFDLIYARPNQTHSEWEKELSQALSFDANHLSLYQLTIEPNTTFASLYRQGQLKMPADDLCADLYDLTNAIMEKHNYSRYEVSNYAKSGFECKHNQAYWHYDDYIGVGPGAHGRITLKNGGKIATKQKRTPEKWITDTYEKENQGYDEMLIIQPVEQAIEAVLMGLRVVEGVSLSKTSGVLDQLQVKRFVSQGLLELKDNQLKCTTQGILYLNHILEKIIMIP